MSMENAPKRVRIISRTYCGVFNAEALRHIIIRSFFNEELKCIKREVVEEQIMIFKYIKMIIMNLFNLLRMLIMIILMNLLI